MHRQVKWESHTSLIFLIMARIDVYIDFRMNITVEE